MTGSTGTVTRVARAAVFWSCLLLCRQALALDHTQLAVIINVADPLSVQIGNYYAERRRIPARNIINVEFKPGSTGLTRQAFDAIKATIDQDTPRDVQAYALTWAAPYRVECMSITSALAFGFDPEYCAEGCKATRQSAYYNSPVTLPYAQLHVRPAMTVAARTFEQAKALIDRGILSDGSYPSATAYLLSTSDKARNVRSDTYPLIERMLARHPVRAHRVRLDALWGAGDVLFYFTGREMVEGLQTLHFVPGAIADHLTSFGGMLTDSSQMSVLRWLEAGATGSYGTVVEPCGIPQKFPNVLIAIGRYLQGETLIEAYWKSVAMPGQGIFVGEPLAAPFRRRAKR